MSIYIYVIEYLLTGNRSSKKDAGECCHGRKPIGIFEIDRVIEYIKFVLMSKSFPHERSICHTIL